MRPTDEQIKNKINKLICVHQEDGFADWDAVAEALGAWVRTEMDHEIANAQNNLALWKSVAEKLERQIIGK